MARNAGLKVKCEHSRSLSEVSGEGVGNSLQNATLSLPSFHLILAVLLGNVLIESHILISKNKTGIAEARG